MTEESCVLSLLDDGNISNIRKLYSSWKSCRNYPRDCESHSYLLVGKDAERFEMIRDPGPFLWLLSGEVMRIVVKSSWLSFRAGLGLGGARTVENSQVSFFPKFINTSGQSESWCWGYRALIFLYSKVLKRSSKVVSHEFTLWTTGCFRRTSTW